LSLRAVADARAWAALVDLLTAGLDEPKATFSPSLSMALFARNLNYEQTGLYELRCPAHVFEEYSCPAELHVELWRHHAREALRGARGSLALEAAGGELRLGGRQVGRVVKAEEHVVPPRPAIPELVNEAADDGYRLRRFLLLAQRACVGDARLGLSWDAERREVRAVAFGAELTWVEYRFSRSAALDVKATSVGVHSVPLLLTYMPPSALPKGVPTEVRLRASGRDGKPLEVELSRMYPGGAHYTFWVAPRVEEELESFKRRVREPRPKPTARAVVGFQRAPLLFDLLRTNAEEPQVLFGPEALAARNMDPSRITLHDMRASGHWFIDYEAPEPVFARITRRREKLDALLDVAALLEENVELGVVGDALYLNGSKVGEVEREKREFEAPEVKVELKSAVEVDGRGLASLLRDMERKIPRGFVALAYDPAWPALKLIFTDEAGEAWEEVEAPAATQELAERFVSAFRVDYVRMFLPPSSLRAVPPLFELRTDTLKPLKLSFKPYADLRFEAYVAPDVDVPMKVAKRLGWLKPLTEEAVLEALRAKAKPMTASEIMEALALAFYDVEGAEKLMDRLAREGKLVRERKGWSELYRLPDVEPRLKPLTEEAVLRTIGELCSKWDTDAVGFGELETVLAPEYQISPLRDMLNALKEKGLVESKPRPSRRRGPYAADARGYWALRPAEPEEAVRRAEEAEKLKELTEEAVLSALRKLNEEAGLNVYYDSLKERLLEGGYDTSRLPDLVKALRDRGLIHYGVDGTVWVKAWYEERVRPKPPPVPEGFRRVHFKRDMVRYIGFDRRRYGPFKACEEAAVEEGFAEAFIKHGYAEPVGAPPPPRPAEAREVGWEEAKKAYMRWRVE
jgi:hypothetical protein